MTQSKMDTASDAEIGLLGLQIPEIGLDRFYSGVPVQAPSEPTWQARKATVIDHKMMVVKDSGLNADQQSDVDLSQLLAQLNSDKLFSQESQMPKWFENYEKVLGKYCFWTIHGMEFQKYETSDSTFSLDKVAIQTLMNILSDVPKATIENLVKGAIDKIKGLAEKGDPDANLFGRGHSGAHGAKCMIGYAYPGQSGPRIKLAAFHFKIQEDITNLLAFKVRSRDTEVWYATAEMEQSTSTYTTIQPGSGKSQRQLVKEKVLGNAGNGLQELDI
ncbi:hypothetical protein [Nocardiopsis sp. LOL_012]|uniref:hypothetical protein n=1 Tax=Nocardiopsis sp. LOL_012 TaxID=3345409 RepID=UPI003A8C6DFF